MESKNLGDRDKDVVVMVHLLLPLIFLLVAKAAPASSAKMDEREGNSKVSHHIFACVPLNLWMPGLKPIRPTPSYGRLGYKTVSSFQPLKTRKLKLDWIGEWCTKSHVLR